MSNETNSVRQCAASECASMASELAKLADDIETLIRGKLQPYTVMIPQAPSCLATACNREFPEYFAMLRSDFSKIESSLEAIKSAVARSEL